MKKSILKQHVPQAFTLVELLVVVAIIALLLSILLPALGKARHVAKITKCAAELSAVGKANFVYLTENNDRLPIVGDAWYLRQFSYLMYGKNGWGGFSGPQNQGLLISTDILEYDTNTLFCPLQKSISLTNSNGDLNHPNCHNDVLPEHKNKYPWVNGRSGYIRRWFGEKGPTDSIKLSQLPAYKSYLADIFSLPDYVTNSHGDSVNVCYVDTHVELRTLDPKQDPLQKITAFSVGSNEQMRWVWESFELGSPDKPSVGGGGR